MSSRLSFAFDHGLSLPAQGLVRLWHPPADIAVESAEICAVQPNAALHAALSARGTPVTPDSDGACARASIVFVPKAKALARHLIAQAISSTSDLVVVDGDKTAGIDPLYKALRKQTDILGTATKAHGRVFWFEPVAGLCSDWVAPPQSVDGYMTAPGVFSADKIDPASHLLAETLPRNLKGHGIDLGAGWGYLGARVLQDNPAASRIDLVEADHSALRCARANVDDKRAAFHWADATAWHPDEKADFVVTNPPFHTGRAAEPRLGQSFLHRARHLLKPSGRLFAVANRHLPYEATLAENFADWSELAGDNRFKVLTASRPRR